MWFGERLEGKTAQGHQVGNKSRTRIFEGLEPPHSVSVTHNLGLLLNWTTVTSGSWRRARWCPKLHATRPNGQHREFSMQEMILEQGFRRRLDADFWHRSSARLWFLDTGMGTITAHFR